MIAINAFRRPRARMRCEVGRRGFLLTNPAAGHLVLLRRYPRGLFDLLLGLNRWGFRTVEQEDPARLLNQLLAADPPTYEKGRLS